jgi:hypothetical protein
VLYWQIFLAGRTEELKELKTKHPTRQVSAAFPELSPFVSALLIAVPVAYLVQGIVLFDVLVIYLNVFLFLAFATYKLHKQIPRNLLSSRNGMRSILRMAFFAVLLLLAVLSIWFGALLPWRKARSFVQAIHSLSAAKNLEEVEAVFSKPLSLASPIGQEDVVRLLGDDFVMVNLSTTAPEPVARALVLFIEPHLLNNNAFHLMMGGNLYNVLWKKYHRDEYLTKAEAYYRAALALGPKLTPVNVKPDQTDG